MTGPHTAAEGSRMGEKASWFRGTGKASAEVRVHNAESGRKSVVATASKRDAGGEGLRVGQRHCCPGCSIPQPNRTTA